MAKRPLDIDVYEAAAGRISEAFDWAETISLSFSGGKDSTVMLHLVAAEARRRRRHFRCLFIDMEAQYANTISHVEALFAEYRDVIHPEWVCLPLILRNGISQFQPRWYCWDPAKEDRWVRTPPDFAITSSDEFPFFRQGMEFEEFVEDYGEWISRDAMSCCFVGIRADESLNRWRTITSKKKRRYRGKGWTTIKKGNAVNVYPIYDWRTEDIWTYHARNPRHAHNPVYDLMHQAGLTIHQMRLCQPYGDDQRKGLWLFHVLEPETWELVVARVAGANFGGMYAAETGSALGYLKVDLPGSHTWESYAYLLLDSMPPDSRHHFESKIQVFLNWYETRGFPDGIPDEAPPKLEAAKRLPSWRRVCKTLVKLDWWCKGLSFSQTRSDGYAEYQRKIKVTRGNWK